MPTLEETPALIPSNDACGGSRDASAEN